MRLYGLRIVSKGLTYTYWTSVDLATRKLISETRMVSNKTYGLTLCIL